jgi:cellulase/cellobiase CelA1
MLNGINVPEWLAVTPTGKLTVEDYNRLTNADHKVEFIRKFGVERMLCMGKKIDSFEKYKKEWWTRSQYELWDMNCIFDGVNYAPHLKMLNQTTGVWHVEAVSPDCKNLKDAIKERFNGMDLDIQAIA